MITIIYIILVFLRVLANGFFVASEFAPSVIDKHGDAGEDARALYKLCQPQPLI